VSSLHKIITKIAIPCNNKDRKVLYSCQCQTLALLYMRLFFCKKKPIIIYNNHHSMHGFKMIVSQDYMYDYKQLEKLCAQPRMHIVVVRR